MLHFKKRILIFFIFYSCEKKNQVSSCQFSRNVALFQLAQSLQWSVGGILLGDPVHWSNAGKINTDEKRKIIALAGSSNSVWRAI
jgi:hypothetical protein